MTAGQLDLFVDDEDETIGWATFSETGLYRYTLGRRWGEGPPLVWIMLNPSTADAEVLDPTIRRCMSFTKREGHGALVVLNLYAWRATKPKELLCEEDPEGPGNFAAWHEVLSGPTAGVVAAFGAFPKTLGLPAPHAMRAAPVRPREWLCLGTTKEGQPRHPLYVKGDTPLVLWLDTWKAEEDRTTTTNGGD